MTLARSKMKIKKQKLSNQIKMAKNRLPKYSNRNKPVKRKKKKLVESWLAKLSNSPMYDPWGYPSGERSNL